MGFRRLREYNLALLAKQAWRVSLCPGTVLHSVLCHKYFPGATFFEARLGVSPSFTWRSIWEARHVIAAGIRWKVGNGQSISIMGHPWLPRPSTFQLICRPTNLSEDSTVSTLITPNQEWDEHLIRTEFCALDADCILGISIGGSSVFDELVWHFEGNGKFSVRSAYKLWAISDLPWGGLSCNTSCPVDWLRGVYGELGLLPLCLLGAMEREEEPEVV
ncbi:UNVERIFIED_CONTAM: putative ribonuclease H protein [Sesamum latifolium]|uniref:Ribonuclease H protein n=1 Tax=Sesamum latifolium TaxID=2727402 RepID=A0AAW2WZD5_9LAMI